VEDPEDWYVPAGQSGQDVCPVEGWNWPAGQEVNAPIPVAPQDAPAGHETHDDCPVLAWYLPAAQLAQPVTPSGEYWPAAQAQPLEQDAAVMASDRHSEVHESQSAPTYTYALAASQATLSVWVMVPQ
jgi:hypothetical protein